MPNLEEHPVHLGRGASVVSEPVFTADVRVSATALFITAGIGTQNRPR